MLLKQRLGRKARSLTLGWTFTAFAEISRAVELHLAEARCPLWGDAALDVGPSGLTEGVSAQPCTQLVMDGTGVDSTGL